MSQYRAALLQLFSDVLQVDIPPDVRDLRRADSEEWDSVNHLRLLMALEEQFGVVISDDLAANLTSLGDVEELLQRAGARSTPTE